MTVTPQTIPYMSRSSRRPRARARSTSSRACPAFSTASPTRKASSCKRGPADVPARPEAVPGAARRGARRAAVAAGAASPPRRRTSAASSRWPSRTRCRSRISTARRASSTSAKAAVFSAQAKVTEAELNLGYATIRSPVTGAREPRAAAPGRVRQLDGDRAPSSPTSRRSTRSGSTSASRRTRSAKWREMVDKGQLVRPEGRRTTTSSSCCPTARATRTAGKISFADPSFSQDTGSFLVRAVLPNPKRELRPGMFVTARRARRDAAERDRRAAARGAAGLERPPRVRRQRERRRRGPAGASSATTSATRTSSIVSGLHAGDRVVVDGVLKVVPGQPVKIVAPARRRSAGRRRRAPPPKRRRTRRSSAAACSRTSSSTGRSCRRSSRS